MTLLHEQRTIKPERAKNSKFLPILALSARRAHGYVVAMTIMTCESRLVQGLSIVQLVERLDNYITDERLGTISDEDDLS
jgi:hypothetical protein